MVDRLTEIPSVVGLKWATPNGRHGVRDGLLAVFGQVHHYRQQPTVQYELDDGGAVNRNPHLQLLAGDRV